MVTATRTTKSFKVSCPLCGASDANLGIDLNDLQTITCGECSETFTPRQAVEKTVEQLRRWQAVARWAEMAGEVLAGSGEEE